MVITLFEVKQLISDLQSGEQADVEVLEAVMKEMLANGLKEVRPEVKGWMGLAIPAVVAATQGQWSEAAIRMTEMGMAFFEKDGSFKEVDAKVKEWTRHMAPAAGDVVLGKPAFRLMPLAMAGAAMEGLTGKAKKFVDAITQAMALTGPEAAKLVITKLFNVVLSRP